MKKLLLGPALALLLLTSCTSSAQTVVVRRPKPRAVVVVRPKPRAVVVVQPVPVVVPPPTVIVRKR